MNEGRYAPSRDVLWCEHGDLTIVLSLRTSVYTSLTGPAAVVWARICTGQPLSPPGTSDVYSNRDFQTADLLSHLESLSLIQRGDGGPRQEDERERESAGVRLLAEIAKLRFVRVPSVAACCLWLGALRLALWSLGLWRVLHLVRRVGASGEMGTLTEEDVQMLLRRTKVARAICPVRTACLEQALFILCVLCRFGASPCLRIGVHPYPFAAHAWVEQDGVPLVDSREDLLRFRPFPPIDPSRL